MISLRTCLAVALLALPLSLSAQPRSLDDIETDLEDARTYRLGYPLDKSRSALREEWRGQDRFSTFVTLRREVQDYLLSPPDGTTDADRERALRILRECVNESLSGQLQVGNEQLLNAGRRKFPSVISPASLEQLRAPYDERDEWKELALAAAEFDMSILEALDAVRSVPESKLPLGEARVLRSRGGDETINTPAEGFPTYTIIDQPEFEAANSQFIRTEANLLTGTLSRRGLAASALVDRMRRLAYRANNEVEGRQRHGEQGEKRKEEYNRLAMERAKRDGQLMFYSGLILRSQLQATSGDVNRDDFKLHNGDKLFASMSQLNILFKDIRDGRPPTGIADQFVPSPNKRVGGQQGYLSDAITSVSRAKESQQLAEARLNQFQQAQVSQVERNRGIREQYLTQIGQLTGFLVDADAGVLADPLDEGRVFTLSSAEDRGEFLDLLDERIEEATNQLREGSGQTVVAQLGTIGSALVRRQQTFISAELAQEKVNQIGSSIGRIEQKTQRANATTEKYTQKRNVNALIIGVLQSVYDGIIAGKPDNPFNASPSASIAAGARTFLGTIDRISGNLISQSESIEFRNLDSEFQIKEILGGVRSSELEVDIQLSSSTQASLEIDQLRRQISDLVENLNIYRVETSELWYLDPSLEREKEDAEIQADLDLQDCLATLYDLTRALEFYWTEDFQNPVQTIDGGIVTLPNFANDFTEIDDLYAITDAFDAEKYLNAVGFNLSAGSAAGWDSTLRALRQSVPATNQTVLLSLRKDILGFVVPERVYWDVALDRPGDKLVQIHEAGHILSGFENAYAYYENEAITKFRDALHSGRRDAWEFAFGTGRDPQRFRPGFEMVFSTNEKSAYYYDAREWNARIETIQVDVRTEGGFLPPGQEENFIRLNLIQEGTVKFRRSFPLELSDAQFDVYQTEFRYRSDRLRVSPYEFPVHASVNGSTGQFGGQVTPLPYFFSPICSSWRVVLDPLSHTANNYADINKIKDIRLIMTLRSGIPPTLAEGL
ncbi:MAG: hypothetical protein RLY93_01640 [Sumerlaeia bacterium]